MRGNEDRRAGGTDHTRAVTGISTEVGAALDAVDELKLHLTAVENWTRRTGLTGYYKSERDNAHQALNDALANATALTARINRALAFLKYIP